MNELHLPWLMLCSLTPLAGAIWVSRLRDAERARSAALVFASAALLLSCGAWCDFLLVSGPAAGDPWDPGRWLASGRKLLMLDPFSAPLLPLAALLYLLTDITTLRTKVRRFNFAGTLVSEALVLATLACREPWLMIGLMAASTLPPYWELRERQQPTRVYVVHMALFVGLMVLGWALVEREARPHAHSWWAILPLMGAIFVRSGSVPVHCWMTDLFEHATFGTALLFVTPITGAYAAVRLVLPIAPDWVLRSIGILSLITAVYAAGMALVQREARRFFCYVFLSHAALVLVGLETAAPIGLTGALCVWLSVGLALSGFGLTLRALEARHGRLSLESFRGGYEHTPMLAVCFLLTGMASVGFPGTFGFLGTELLVDGAVQTYPYVGVGVVLAAALNGVAVVQAYFRLFTGARHVASVPLGIRFREQFAVLALAGLILGGGLFPQPGVASRFRAAMGILRQRQQAADPAPPPQPDARGLGREPQRAPPHP